MSLRDTSGNLFACHCCELIGPEDTARRHQRATGHDVEEIDAGNTAEIRELWREHGRDPVDGSYPAPRLDVGALIGLARLRGSARRD